MYENLVSIFRCGWAAFINPTSEHSFRNVRLGQNETSGLGASQASQVSNGCGSWQVCTLPTANPIPAPAFPKLSITIVGINRHGGGFIRYNRERPIPKKRLLVFALGVFRPKPFCLCGVAGVSTAFTIPHLPTN